MSFIFCFVFIFIFLFTSSPSFLFLFVSFILLFLFHIIYIFIIYFYYLFLFHVLYFCITTLNSVTFYILFIACPSSVTHTTCVTSLCYFSVLLCCHKSPLGLYDVPAAVAVAVAVCSLS